MYKRQLQAEGHTITPGASGENLTIAGLRWAELKLGDRLRIGDAVRLEIVKYTEPCRFNAQWFQDGNFNRINQRKHPGWSRVYARVLAEGLVRTGDTVVVETEHGSRA